MEVDIYIQARMGSTRLPGKVLKEVMGRPLLDYLIERLSHATEARTLAVLTSQLPKDDPIANYCLNKQLPFIRGSETDLLARYQQAASHYHPDAIVRITADCPLMDPVLVDEMIRIFKNAHPSWDCVSNVIHRTFPKGMDIEIFSREALEKTYHEATDSYDREHVFPYLYRHPALFSLHNVTQKEDQSACQITVDTLEDFERIKRVIEKLYPYSPLFSMSKIVAVLKKETEI